MGFHVDALFIYFFLQSGIYFYIIPKDSEIIWYLFCHFTPKWTKSVFVRVSVVLRAGEREKKKKPNFSQVRSALICETLTGSIIASYCLRESGAYCAGQESRCY